jgi:ATP-dependent DNA helicase RecG
MTSDELIAQLGKYEWSDVECKKAQHGVPNDAYETVCAFANTAGGYLVFGVKDTQGSLEIVGVIEVDKVQNDFLSCLRIGSKLNRVVAAREDAIEHEGKTLLVFHIPEAQRNEKPLYLNGDIRKSYIRRGGGDERCTQAEIERFLRDGADGTYDGEALRDLDAEVCFDESSVAWYRNLLQHSQGGRHAELSDIEFLHEWGFLVEADDCLVPKRAAVLLFGKSRYVRQILPRGVVDYQRIDVPFDEWSPDKRWHDRVVVEENIVQAWQVLVERYMRLAEWPFSVDAATLRRHDDPPDYISFREAAINLLIHQDYGEHTRKPVIKIFADRTVFWNPGDAFVTVDQLLEPTEKDVRNPAIVNAFRRIGLSDQAGTGIRSIFGNWRQLGYVPPVIENDRAEKTFQLLLLKDPLLTERQRLIQAQLGADLSDDEAAVLAYACRTDTITIADTKAVIGGGNRDAREVLDRLVTMVLLRAVEPGVVWSLAEHLEGRFRGSDQPGDQPEAPEGDLVTDQPDGPEANLVTPLLTNLTDRQRKIIELCEVPRKQADLMSVVGLTHRTFFRRKHLEPLLQARLVHMTHPDEPNHPDQAYVVTEAGLGLLSSWKDTAGGQEDQ